MSGKYICNYCFVAECLDLHPEDINKTKCTGLSKEDSEKGLACEYIAKKIAIKGGN